VASVIVSRESNSGSFVQCNRHKIVAKTAEPRDHTSTASKVVSLVSITVATTGNGTGNGRRTGVVVFKTPFLQRPYDCEHNFFLFRERKNVCSELFNELC
jgi:hypothetical protein